MLIIWQFDKRCASWQVSIIQVQAVLTPVVQLTEDQKRLLENARANFSKIVSGIYSSAATFTILFDQFDLYDGKWSNGVKFQINCLFSTIQLTELIPGLVIDEIRLEATPSNFYEKRRNAAANAFVEVNGMVSDAVADCKAINECLVMDTPFSLMKSTIGITLNNKKCDVKNV